MALIRFGSGYTRQSQQNPGITDSTVLDIRRAYYGDDITTVSDVAREFGIHSSTASRIIHYNTWAHVPEPVTLPTYSDYEIYPDGRILNARGQFLTTSNRKDGTLTVRVLNSRTNKREVVPVAQLVFRAFVKETGKIARVEEISYADSDMNNVHMTNLFVEK